MTSLEQGQLVILRNRFYIVQDIFADAVSEGSLPFHRVVLECINDDRLGETLSVIWEKEINCKIYDGISLPEPPNESERWDSPTILSAFLKSVEWSSASFMEGTPLSAPFRAAIDLEDYQLEPVVRAIEMPRVSLLIADDVGLGKTIEAGLVAQELLARSRIRRIMILCPASLQRQWQEEMTQKFNLRFEIIDRSRILDLRREYGLHVNPWNSFPRIITSIDFLKRERPLNSFLESLDRPGSSNPLRQWDLLIVDEAHNAAPSGKSDYVVASDRTVLMNNILPNFEHRLFLTATPHNGYTESFTALLEMLDPLRFTRSDEVDKEQVKLVMVRRLKDELLDSLGEPRFMKRRVVSLPPVVLNGDERRLFELLNAYSISRRQNARNNSELFGVEFALTILKKRLLSSIYAFSHSLATHKKTLGYSFADNLSEETVKTWQRRLREEYDDDDERSRDEDAALEEAGGFFAFLTPKERKALEDMSLITEKIVDGEDSKSRILIDWISETIMRGREWTEEKVVVFTEYIDTLKYLERRFEKLGWKDRSIRLIGGMNAQEREDIKYIFQSKPEENPVRILLATDAASEGLNLQNYCRYLVHYEIPWNPNRMEQRNGRIDRKGQRREPCCHHFVYSDRQDQRFLDVIVDKVKNQRRDLGAIGEVISRQLEAAIVRNDDADFDKFDGSRLKKASDEIVSTTHTPEELNELVSTLDIAREELELTPDSIRAVLNEALKLEGHPGLEPITDVSGLAGKAWLLSNIPDSWRACRRYITNSKGARLKLIFDSTHQRDDKQEPRRDVALIHLNHPLMERAIGAFRKNIWSFSDKGGKRLQKVSYRIIDGKSLYLVFHTRTVGLNLDNRKLRERTNRDVFTVSGQKLSAASVEFRALLARVEKEWKPIPKETADKLRNSLWPYHKTHLETRLKELEKLEREDIEITLGDKTIKETSDTEKLIAIRIKECRKRQKSLKDKIESSQLALFDKAELESINDDLRFLEKRIEELEAERKERPRKIKRKYSIRSLRVFPLALEYFIPRELLGEDK